jgi:hypothetical protein
MAQPAPAQGVTVQAATGQGDTSQPAPVSAQTAPEVKGPIPYERFDEVNKKAKTFEEQNAQLQTQLLQMQGFLQQVAAQRQATAPVAAPVDPVADFITREKIGADGFVSPADLKKVIDFQNQVTEQRVAQFQFQQQYGDYDQVVGAVNPLTGQWVNSDLLNEAIKEDPKLPGKIQRSGNPREYAYDIVMKQKQIRELRNSVPATPTPDQLQQQARATQNTVEARLSPMSPSAVGGPPATTTEIDALNLLRTNPKAFDELVRSIGRGKYG